MICTTCKHKRGYCPADEDAITQEAYDIKGCIFYKERIMNEHVDPKMTAILNLFVKTPFDRLKPEPPKQSIDPKEKENEHTNTD